MKKHNKHTEQTLSDSLFAFTDFTSMKTSTQTEKNNPLTRFVQDSDQFKTKLF